MWRWVCVLSCAWTCAGQPVSVPVVVKQYCVGCHNEKVKIGGLALDPEHIATASRRLGEGDAQAPRAADAAGRMPRPDERDVRRRGRVAGNDARPRRGGEAESRPHGHVPPAESHRVPERDPRSAGARRRRRVAAAGRRVEPRVRQRDGRRPVADAAGPVRLGGARRSAGWRSGGRARRPAATRSASRRTSRRRSTSTGCRSARAAARWSATRSRSTASTRSRSG